jgi:hypothetical protein
MRLRLWVHLDAGLDSKLRMVNADGPDGFAGDQTLHGHLNRFAPRISGHHARLPLLLVVGDEAVEALEFVLFAGRAQRWRERVVEHGA